MNMFLKAAAGAMIALLMLAALGAVVLVDALVVTHFFDNDVAALVILALLITQFGALVGATA